MRDSIMSTFKGSIIIQDTEGNTDRTHKTLLPQLNNMKTQKSGIEFSIKKKLKEHLMIQEMYDRTPNYKALAKEIISGQRKKSTVGLLDHHKYLVCKAR